MFSLVLKQSRAEKPVGSPVLLGSDAGFSREGASREDKSARSARRKVWLLCLHHYLMLVTYAGALAGSGAAGDDGNASGAPLSPARSLLCRKLVAQVCCWLIVSRIAPRLVVGQKLLRSCGCLPDSPTRFSSCPMSCKACTNDMDTSFPGSQCGCMRVDMLHLLWFGATYLLPGAILV